jgi:nucleotide-binding universal stress UspA family protein
MQQKNKRILVAIDGSDQSLNAVRYLSKLPFSSKPKVVLFHVIRRIDQAFWDIGVSPMSRGQMTEISGWDLERKKKAQEFMNLAFEILVEVGFPRESVRVNIHNSKVGVARDIIKESINGYDAVVVGRRGLNKLKDLVLGSIAVKLVEKLSHVPVWVIGGNPEPGRILVALDASEGSMKAVDHLGAMAGGSKTHVELFHAIRALKTSQFAYAKTLDADYEKELVKEINEEMEITFTTAKEHLVNAGLDAQELSTKFNAGVSSRASAIIGEARLGAYGTIVMGRRGLSKVEDFLMGRVTNKVLHMVKNRAVWIVN